MALFNAKCSMCHTVSETKNLGGATAAGIKRGITNNSGGMGNVARGLTVLTTAELTDIAAYVAP
jgi:mono/diheme cytochrome c family protein